MGVEAGDGMGGEGFEDMLDSVGFKQDGRIIRSLCSVIGAVSIPFVKFCWLRTDTYDTEICEWNDGRLIAKRCTRFATSSLVVYRHTVANNVRHLRLVRKLM